MRTEENLCLQPRNQTYSRGSFPSPKKRAGLEPRDPREAPFSHINLTVFTSTPRGKDSHFTGEESEAQRLSGTSKATQRETGKAADLTLSSVPLWKTAAVFPECTGPRDPPESP